MLENEWQQAPVSQERNWLKLSGVGRAVSFRNARLGEAEIKAVSEQSTVPRRQSSGDNTTVSGQEERKLAPM